MKRSFRHTTDQDEVRLGLIRSLEFPVRAIELLSTEAHYTSGVPVVVTVSGGTTDTSEIVYRIAKRWQESDPDEWYEERSEVKRVAEHRKASDSDELYEDALLLAFQVAHQRASASDPFARRILSFKEWDIDNYIPPNDTAIIDALGALQAFQRFAVVPEMINPTLEGSITFEFVRDTRYILLEFFNEGTIVYLDRAGDEEPEVREIALEDIASLAQELSNG